MFGVGWMFQQLVSDPRVASSLPLPFLFFYFLLFLLLLLLLLLFLSLYVFLFPSSFSSLIFYS
jgi:hypothetical protein